MKITVVANYFGKAPDCFQLWLDSAGFNRDITWLFYTDFDLGRFVWPENVRPIKSNSLEMRSRFVEKLGFPVTYRTGWDFCNYRPVFGKCFEDALEGCDYWAWADSDLIYGNLGLVVRHCGDADKIMPKGHFSLIRNSAEFNARTLRHPLVQKVLQEGSVAAEKVAFDEEAYPKIIVPAIGMKTFNGVPYANLYARYGHFNLIETLALCEALGIPENSRSVTHIPCVFTWKDGNLTGWFAMPMHEVKTVALAYIHFFKRQMTPKTARLEKGRAYLVVPNEIREYDGHDLSWDEICRLDRFRIHWSYFRKRLNLKTFRRKLFGK